MNPLLKGFRVSCKPPDRRPPWRWCEDHVVVDSTSAAPGKYRSDYSPWAREIMEEGANNQRRRIVVKCSAQSAKTQTTMGFACHIVAEDPGPAMWVLAARDEAQEFLRDRMRPTFEQCAPCSERLIKAKSSDVVFSTMPFYFVGAGSDSKLQGKPIRWLFLDEVRNYDAGALETVLKRTRSFWNSRQIIISTPRNEGDAMDREYLAGDQRVWHFPCPKCGHLQQLLFEQLCGVNPDTGEACKFSDVPGAVNDDGTWAFDRLAYYIRYKCCSCGHLIEDTTVERKRICREGKFVAVNPKAEKHVVSFHWNALLPHWVSWRSIVEEHIRAIAAMRLGDRNPLKTFVNETLGLSWKDELGFIDDFDFLEARRADYDFGDTWPEEKIRFMSVDYQEGSANRGETEHFWYLIRAYSAGGKSRLITYGKADTFAELEEIRKDNGVHPGNCLIDSGWRATQVYRFCASTGWKAAKGDDKEFFLVHDKRIGKTVRKIWRAVKADPYSGTKRMGRIKPITLLVWCNDPIKDVLAERQKGLPGAGEWTIPNGTPDEYLRHVSAERRDHSGHWELKVQKTPNHLGDCECMCEVAAGSYFAATGRPAVVLATGRKQHAEA